MLVDDSIAPVVVSAAECELAGSIGAIAAVAVAWSKNNFAFY